MKHIIALDIGGTKIHGALFSGNKILKDLTVATPQNLLDFKKTVLKTIDFLSATEQPDAIGIGMAGLIDSSKGVVKYSPNIKFIKNFNLVAFLNQNGFKKVKIDNDANCFTRAELFAGEGRKFKNFLALTLGTGIGGGIVIDKKIYRGTNNSGAEFGHVVSGNDFVEAEFQKYRNIKDFKTVGHILGKNFAGLINIFEPEAIILGGSVSTNENPKFMPSAKIEIKKFLFNKKASTKIIISKLKNAGTLGAAFLFAGERARQSK